MDVLIKNVSEEAWKKFKIGAIEEGLNLGEYFNGVINEKKKSKGNAWKILDRKGFLTDEEAKEIKKSIKEFRNGFKMREFKWD